MGDPLARLRALATGRCTWIDTETGEREHDVLDWRSRWNLFGVHSSDWRWVRRFGRRGCGCTLNPLTRRRVLTDMDCATHGHRPWRRDTLMDDWCSDEEWRDEWT